MEQKTIIHDNIEEIDEKELDFMARKFLEEIRVTSKDIADTSFAKTVSQLSDVDFAKSMIRIIKEHTTCDSDWQKTQIVKGIIRTSWLQRIHSTIRSLILGSVTAIILLPIFLIFGSLNIIQNILLFVPIVGSGLVITRLLDKQMIIAAKRIVNYLSKHKKLRNFLMNYV
ncbi:MAG: hypothetical protein P8X91_03175 [Candidatus Bathyarchaeota archaeon]